MPCLRIANSMFTHCKWHIYNLQVMVFWLTTCFVKDAKMLKRKHFYPSFAQIYRMTERQQTKPYAFKTHKIIVKT